MYSYEELTKEFESLNEKLRQRAGFTKEDGKRGKAIGYAIDAMDMAKDRNFSADMTLASSEDLPKLVMAAYYHKEAQGKSSSECRIYTAKLVGSYLLFAVSNWYEEKGEDATVSFEKSTPVVISGEKNVEVMEITDRFVRNNLKFNKGEKVMLLSNPGELIDAIKPE